jgi:glyoxylase-like metal-dependent hydrolase (beta-lactamase superfamily II)
MQNFAYLIGDEASGVAALVDPTAQWPLLESQARHHGLNVTRVFNTHSHPDHTAGNDYFRARGAQVVAHESAPTRPEVKAKDGDSIAVGGLDVSVVHTPGHRFDAVCFLVGKLLFTGDTLFIGECGRTDLPGSDPGAMHHTLLTVLRRLPDDLVIMPGHNYGPVPSRTLGEEKRLNYTLQPRTLEEFLEFMRAP